MSAEEYLKEQLQKLKSPAEITSADNLEEQIVNLILSKKFRKYAANADLIEHVKNVVHYSVSRNLPINFTFLHGAYKLWRLEEFPEADWAELFSTLYYSRYVKPICAIYKPGVWFDFFVDDYIIEIIDNLTPAEIAAYLKSYQAILNFLKPYQSKNLKMTITTVGSQFSSRKAFDESLAKNLEALEMPILDESTERMVTLNVRPVEGQMDDPLWKEKVYRIHNAYMITKGEPGYHKNRPDKILVFSQPLPSGTTISLGTTKSSIAKFWAGVGALMPAKNSYQMLVLPPSQLKSADYLWEPINLGLPGKNFKRIRIIKPKGEK